MELTDMKDEVITTSEISPYYLVKCLFAGCSGVGKSSIVHLINNDTQDLTSEPTIGINFASTKIELKEYPVSDTPDYYKEIKCEMLDANMEKDFQLVKAHMWDAAGSANFRSVIVSSYIRDIDIAFLVFDLTNRQSLEALKKWKTDIDNASKYPHALTYVLVANKCDLYNYEVRVEEVEELAKKWKCRSFIMSSRRDNASHWVRKMVYHSIKLYHEKLITLESENKEIPDHVKKSHYEVSPVIELDVSKKQSYCCFQ